MSGETEKNISAWTNDTVLVHLAALIDANDRRYQDRFQGFADLFAEKDLRDQQRFDAQQLALRDALTSQEKAVNAALLAAQEAVQKAEAAAEKRFDAVNEFRAQLADQAATLMPRQETTVLLDGITERLGATEKRINESGGRSQGRDDVWGYIIGAAGIVIAIAAIAAALAK